MYNQKEIVLLQHIWAGSGTLPYYSPVRLVPLFPSYRQETDSERWSDLSKVTQLANGKSQNLGQSKCTAHALLFRGAQQGTGEAEEAFKGAMTSEEGHEAQVGVLG